MHEYTNFIEKTCRLKREEKNRIIFKYEIIHGQTFLDMEIEKTVMLFILEKHSFILRRKFSFL